MTFLTEFLEREPFYTYFDAFTPRVPIFVKKERILYTTRKSGPSSASGGDSIQTWLSAPSLGAKVIGPLQSPIAAKCPFQSCLDQHHFEVHHCWRCFEGVSSGVFDVVSQQHLT